MFSLGPEYKHTHLEVDLQNKSERVEWGHCRYQAAYRPDCAFEMVVQWVAASGAIICDLVSIVGYILEAPHHV